MSYFQKTQVVISAGSKDDRIQKSETSRRSRARRGRYSVVACEQLEGRVVLTSAGVSTSLLGSLSYAGVVTSLEVSVSIPVLPILPVLPGPLLPLTSAARMPAWSQLGKDLQALRTELQSLAAKSGVTIADLESLTNDSQAIAQGGFDFDVKSLNSAISELATAVAGQTSTSQAQTDFTALFSGSSVSSTTITNTFNDLVKTIQDSAVTTTDLSTVAADEAAIQADLPKLPIGWYGGAEPWLDGVGIAPAAITVAPSVVTPIATPVPAVSVPPLEWVTPAVVLPAQSSGPLTITVSPPVNVGPIIGPSSLSVPSAFIISPFGSANLLGALSSVGVVTSPVIVNPPPITMLPPVTAVASGTFAQLQTDVRALETELQSLAAKSGLTIADLQNLTNDGQAINQAGFYLSVPSLDKVVSELATAVAGGSSTTQAQTDFTALFSNSSVSTATINSAFNDLIKAIQDSKIVPGDLTTVAADQAAIQADLKNLFTGKGGGPGSGTGTTGTGSGTTGTGTGTTGTGSKRSPKGHKPIRHHNVQAHLESHAVVKAPSAAHLKTLSRAKKR